MNLNQELENQLKNMDLKEPSPGLDDRVQALLEGCMPSHQGIPVPSMRSIWPALSVTAAACLILGFGVGFVMGIGQSAATGGSNFDATSYAQPEDRIDSSTAGSTSNGETRGAPSIESISNASTTNEQLTSSSANSKLIPSRLPQDDRRTTILDQRWIKTSDGRFARGYITTTRKRVWRLDPETQALRAHDVTIPRVIVATTPGI